MTLVLSCLTPDYGVQVSDKRITRYSDGAVVDDARNKGIQYFNQMVFAYSGPESIEGIPTDQWFAKTLAPHDDLEPGMESVQRSLTIALARTSAPADRKRLAFVGVGWSRVSGEQGVLPIRVTLSNALSDAGRWEATARPTFDLRSRAFRNRELVHVEPLGGAIDPEALRTLRVKIDGAVKRGAPVLAIITILANAVRSAAATTDRIGKTLLAMVVPREGCDANSMVLSGPFSPLPRTLRSPTFFHLPERPNLIYRTLPAGIGPGGTIHFGGHVTWSAGAAARNESNRASSI